MKFDERPFLAIWETTQACDLACRHCRASARAERACGELSTKEGKGLLDCFAAAGVPLVVLTGGDPAKRPDLVVLVRHGVSRGLTMGLTPSATPLVSRQLVAELAAAGLSRLAISLDAPEPGPHDEFRGVAGSYETSLRILRYANEVGISTQINTSVHAQNIGALPRMEDVVLRSRSVLWSVFYTVPTGRADQGMLPTARQVEVSLHQVAEIASRQPFAVKTTAAPHYRRILLQRKKGRRPVAEHGTRGPSGMRVNDGRGFLFVSHVGDIYPSGFLPIACGNVRSTDPILTYRQHPTFQKLRDSNRFTGKCGVCEYRNVCGGSRARAFALTGDPAASDPLCEYVPAGYQGHPDIFTGARRRGALPVVQG